MKKNPILLALLLALGATAWGQDLTCNRGDVAWVTSAKNANVGLAAGAGRCLANTVAGAAYNDPAMAWGIQGALDCACDGLEIRVLGDTGNYGSATNSWNNRFDANKTVVTSVSGSSGRIAVVGYADQSTPCLNSNTGAGCPVEMNFTGGVTDGWVVGNSAYFIAGIRSTGAPSDCFFISNSRNQLSGVEADNCGDSGVRSTTTGEISIVRSYIHDTGDAATDGGVIFTAAGDDTPMLMFNYIRNITGYGVIANQNHLRMAFNIVQDTTNHCVAVGGQASHFYFNTLRDCGDDGFGLYTAGTRESSALLFNLVTGASGYGIGAIAAGAGWSILFAYNVLGSNGLGDIEAQTVLEEFENVTGATVVFAGPSDSTPLSGAAMTLLYPRGATQITINAGAVTEGGGALLGLGAGAGGVYIPGGPR